MNEMAAGQSENPALVAIKKLIESSWRGKLGFFCVDFADEAQSFRTQICFGVFDDSFEGTEGMADLEMWEINWLKVCPLGYILISLQLLVTICHFNCAIFVHLLIQYQSILYCILKHYNVIFILVR